MPHKLFHKLSDLISSLHTCEDEVILSKIDTSVNAILEEYAESNLDKFSSSDWPIAIHPSMICPPGDRSWKIRRATSIIGTFLALPLKSLRVLDYGCGDGLVAMNMDAASVVGFDLKEDPEWNSVKNTNKCKLTTDFNVVKNGGPYDIIMLYDVIDHSVTEDPIAMLLKLKELLKPDGKIHVRCHPWCSRHGSHTFHSINKAYIHLVFGEEILKRIGCEFQPTLKIIHPIMTYKTWFEQAGLEFTRHREWLEPLENFFKADPFVSWRIKRNWANSHEHLLRNGTVFPEVQLTQQFHDYILVPAATLNAS